MSIYLYTNLTDVVVPLVVDEEPALVVSLDPRVALPLLSSSMYPFG
jgi:hypothetical protein